MIPAELIGCRFRGKRKRQEFPELKWGVRMQSLNWAFEMSYDGKFMNDASCCF